MRYTEADVARVLRLGEDSRNEFKSVRAGLPDVAPAICAFANSGGGRLWLGIGPKAELEGVDRAKADAILTGLDNVFAGQLEPALYCPALKLEHQQRLLIVVEVRAYSPDRPYRARGKYYIRATASNRPATAAEVRKIATSSAASLMMPDELAVPGTTMEDFDEEAFAEFHRAAYGEPPPQDGASLERRLAALRVIVEDELSLMGLLCFGANPQRIRPFARIAAARVRGREMGAEDLDRKEFGGTLPHQVAGVERFIESHLKSPVTIHGFEPERSSGVAPDFWLPLEVVRETVRNAVMHRDYAVTGPIVVTVFDDRVEVVSPGRLINSMNVESMRAGISVARNQRIASVLGHLGLVTQRGSGVPRMIRLMKEAGLPEPRLEERGPALAVTLSMRGGR